MRRGRNPPGAWGTPFPKPLPPPNMTSFQLEILKFRKDKRKNFEIRKILKDEIPEWSKKILLLQLPAKREDQRTWNRERIRWCQSIFLHHWFQSGTCANHWYIDWCNCCMTRSFLPREYTVVWIKRLRFSCNEHVCKKPTWCSYPVSVELEVVLGYLGGGGVRIQFTFALNPPPRSILKPS